MHFTSTATVTVGILLAIVLFQKLTEQVSSQVGLQQNQDIYRNITPMCPSKELCEGRKEEMSSFSGCQCDAMCALYEDCCRDSPFFVPSQIPTRNFTCVKLPIAFSRNIPIKMIASCPPHASPEERTLCGTRNETAYLLSEVPITVTYENNSSLIYRNVFCARCNKVTNASYHLWNTTLVCDSEARGRKPFPDDAEASWDPGKKRWVYVEGNRTLECDLKVIRPDHLKTILPHVKCSVMYYVDQCPNGTDSTLGHLCRSYTALVRWRRRNRMYKNQHCLKCDGGSHQDILCGPVLDFVPRSGISFSGDISKYSVLLRYARSECGPGQHYDDILKECVHLFPPRVVHLETINANPVDTCARAKLLMRHFELSHDNSTVLVPKYERNFTQGQFRFTDNGELEICEKDIPPQPPTFLSIIIAISTVVGFSVSIFFLLLHLCAVILVAALRNLSGITLASLCLALLGGYVSFIVGILLKDEPYLWCYTCAIITYYFFMASFLWMLVLAYDVSKVLKASVRKFRATRGLKWKRFTSYSLVAWGIPIFPCIAVHLVESADSGFVDERFRPMFGLKGCWFGSPHSHLVFFVIPLAVIMVLNFSFFVYAAAVTSENPTGQRKNLRVYVKLTILLGLNWIVGLLAKVMDSDILLVIFSVLNTLQGLFIFLSFTLTSKVSKGLSKTIPCLGRSTKETSPQNTTLKETSFSMKATISQDSTKR